MPYLLPLHTSGHNCCEQTQDQIEASYIGILNGGLGVKPKPGGPILKTV